MSVNQRNPVAYGLSQATIDVPNKPIVAQRSPTDRDKAQIGTLWINATDQSVYIITSIEDNVANWELLTNAGGSVTDLLADDANLVTPLAGVIAVSGGLNINTTGAIANTLTINLNNDVSISGNMEVGGNYSLPNTDVSGTIGVIIFDADRFISNRGTNNTFVGQESGTPLLTVADATDNASLGTQTLLALTIGSNNCAFGSQTLKAATDGSFNTALGFSSLNQLVSGDNNICIGDLSGSAYTTNESDNIIIGNSLGTIGDNNTIRIGKDGTGDDEQDATYIAGIYNRTVGAVASVAVIDSDGKLGSSAALDGQLLIGDTGGKPVWANLTSSGGSVTITNGPNSINLEAAGVAAITQLDADVGTALPVAGVINIVGDGVSASTSGAGNTITITATGTPALTQLSGDTGTATPVGGNIDIVGSSIITTTAAGDAVIVSPTAATNGQIPIGRTDTGIPAWATITAGTGISIVNGANSITINNTGATPTSPAFSYTQTSDYVIPGGTFPFGTIFYLGANVVLTQDFDQGSNVFPGDGLGTPASFVAPVNGIYSLTFEISTIGQGSTNVQGSVNQLIITNLKTFSQTLDSRNFPNPAIVGFQGKLSFTVTAQMNAGHLAQFAYFYTLANPVSPMAATTVFQNYTLIGGYLVSQI